MFMKTTHHIKPWTKVLFTYAVFVEIEIELMSECKKKKVTPLNLCHFLGQPYSSHHNLTWPNDMANYILCVNFYYTFYGRLLD